MMNGMRWKRSHATKWIAREALTILLVIERFPAKYEAGKEKKREHCGTNSSQG